MNEAESNGIEQTEATITCEEAAYDLSPSNNTAGLTDQELSTTVETAMDDERMTFNEGIDPSTDHFTDSTPTPNPGEVAGVANCSTALGLPNESGEVQDQDDVEPPPNPAGPADNSSDEEGDRGPATASGLSAITGIDHHANRSASPEDLGSTESPDGRSVTGSPGSMTSQADFVGQGAFPELTVHPIADTFPPPTPQELEALEESIVAHGRLVVPILVYQNQIVDGRNRYAICRRHGIVPLIQEWDGNGSLIDMAVDLNANRRSMNDAQRALTAARLANMTKGRPKKNAQICGISQEKAAMRLRVSRTCVQLGKQVIDRGTPELITAVERGEVKITVAAEIAKLSTEQQISRLAEGDKPVPDSTRKTRRSNPATRPSGRDRVASTPGAGVRSEVMNPPAQSDDRPDLATSVSGECDPREKAGPLDDKPRETEAMTPAASFDQSDEGRAKDHSGVSPDEHRPLADDNGAEVSDRDDRVEAAVTDATDLGNFARLCRELSEAEDHVLAACRKGVNSAEARSLRAFLPQAFRTVRRVVEALGIEGGPELEETGAGLSLQSP